MKKSKFVPTFLSVLLSFVILASFGTLAARAQSETQEPATESDASVVAEDTSTEPASSLIEQPAQPEDAAPEQATLSHKVQFFISADAAAPYHEEALLIEDGQNIQPEDIPTGEQVEQPTFIGWYFTDQDGNEIDFTAEELAQLPIAKEYDFYGRFADETTAPSSEAAASSDDSQATTPTPFTTLPYKVNTSYLVEITKAQYDGMINDGTQKKTTGRAGTPSAGRYWLVLATETYYYYGLNDWKYPISSGYDNYYTYLPALDYSTGNYAITDSYGDRGVVPTTYERYYLEKQVTKYTLTFNTNGGSAVSPVSLAAGTAIKASQPAAPTKTGYIFAGWYYDAALSDSQAVNWNTDKLNGNRTVYAKWTQVYNLTFTVNNTAYGTLNNSGKLGVGNSTIWSASLVSNLSPMKTYAPVPVPKEGYYFVNWSGDGVIDGKLPETVTANGNYVANFAPKVSLPEASLTVALSDFVYNGVEHKAVVTLQDLPAGTDPTLTYRWRQADDPNWTDSQTNPVFINAGRYELEVTANLPATADYLSLTKTIAFTVAKRNITITPDNEKYDYDGRPHGLSGKFTYDSEQNDTGLLDISKKHTFVERPFSSYYMFTNAGVHTTPLAYSPADKALVLDNDKNDVTKNYSFTFNEATVEIVKMSITANVNATGLWAGHGTAYFKVELRGTDEANKNIIQYQYVAVEGSSNINSFRNQQHAGAVTFSGLPAGNYAVTASTSLRTVGGGSQAVAVQNGTNGTANFQFLTANYAFLSDEENLSNHFSLT